MNSQEHNIEDEGVYGWAPEYLPTTNEEIKCPSCLKPIKDGKCQNVQCIYFQTELADYGLLPKPIEFVDETETHPEIPGLSVDEKAVLEAAGVKTWVEFLKLPPEEQGKHLDRVSRQQEAA